MSISPDSNVHLIPCSDITIPERQRKDKTDAKYRAALGWLVDSLRKYGLLHPIVLTRDLVLVAGETRLLAARQLGWPEIAARFLDECDELQLKEIELEENVARSDLTWHDLDMARARLHLLKIQIYGQASSSHDTHVPTADGLQPLGWSVPKTAQAIGVNDSTVQRSLTTFYVTQIMPEIAEESSRTVALKKIERLAEDLENQIALIDARQSRVAQIESSLWLGDCLNEMARIPSGSVDLILTDPPYGIDYDSIGGSAHRTAIGFDDDPTAILALLRSACKEMRRVLRPSGHLYAFFGIQLWSETLAIYRAAGFDPDPLPIVWVKNTGGSVDWDYRFNPIWEPLLFARSARRLARKCNNVFIVDTEPPPERFHANQKPQTLLRQLIELSSLPGELVLDPFAGSGSTLVAAKAVGRRWLGIEKEPRMYDIAKVRLLGNA